MKPWNHDQELFALVKEKLYTPAAGEKVVRQAIEAGVSATEAFVKFGIL